MIEHNINVHESIAWIAIQTQGAHLGRQNRSVGGEEIRTSNGRRDQPLSLRMCSFSKVAVRISAGRPSDTHRIIGGGHLVTGSRAVRVRRWSKYDGVWRHFFIQKRCRKTTENFCSRPGGSGPNNVVSFSGFGTTKHPLELNHDYSSTRLPAALASNGAHRRAPLDLLCRAAADMPGPRSL